MAASKKPVVVAPGGLPPQPTGYDPQHNFGLWAMRMEAEDMLLVRTGRFDEVCRRAKKPYALNKAAEANLRLAVEEEITWRFKTRVPSTVATLECLVPRLEHVPPVQTFGASKAPPPKHAPILTEPPSSAGHLVVVTGDACFDQAAFPDARRAVFMSILDHLANKVSLYGKGGLVIGGGARNTPDLIAAGIARDKGHAWFSYSPNGEKGRMMPTGDTLPNGQPAFRWTPFGRWSPTYGDDLSLIRALVDRAHQAREEGWKKIDVWTFAGWKDTERSEATVAFFEHLGFPVRLTHVSKEGILVDELDGGRLSEAVSPG